MRGTASASPNRAARRTELLARFSKLAIDIRTDTPDDCEMCGLRRARCVSSATISFMKLGKISSKSSGIGFRSDSMICISSPMLSG